MKKRRHNISLSTWFRIWVKKRAEEKVAHRSNTIIAASEAEAHEVRRMVRAEVYTVPATYRSVPEPSDNAKPITPVRIVHFGRLMTRANVMGLQDYLTYIAPKLPREWELHVIGSYKTADPQLVHRLQQAGARLWGYVEDLTEVLRPFDIAVIPYCHNTGERTKLAQLFNHAQVVVAHQNAVKGTNYVKSGENCLVLPSLDAFPKALIRLANDPSLRKRLGLAAKTTFERELTLQAQMPMFREAIASVMRGREHES